MSAVLSSLQKSKLDRRFALLDLDASGFVGADDYEELARRVAKGAGVDPADERGIAIRDAYLGLWNALRDKYDTNADGRIGRNEWVASVTSSIIERDAFDHTVEPVVRAVLTAYDKDASGTLGLDEYRALASAMSVPGDSIDEAFARLDLDSDGSLTHDELVNAVKEFYTSPDPAAPGNWFYGRI